MNRCRGNENVNDFLLLLFLISAFHQKFVVVVVAVCCLKKNGTILCAHCTQTHTHTGAIHCGYVTMGHRESFVISKRVRQPVHTK